MNSLTSILWGLAGGLAIALSGWYKHHPKPDFDPNKFLETVLISGVIGAIAGATGMAFNEATAFAEAMGLTVLIEQIKKAVLRRYKPDWKI